MHKLEFNPHESIGIAVSANRSKLVLHLAGVLEPTTGAILTHLPTHIRLASHSPITGHRSNAHRARVADHRLTDPPCDAQDSAGRVTPRIAVDADCHASNATSHIL